MDQSSYTLPGIMHYLQNQYTLIEKNRILNELEKSELKLKITKLESEKNMLYTENERLRAELNALKGGLKLSNGEKLNGHDIGQLDSNLSPDVANLLKAKKFLKNTTNEILLLLNSPSLDNSDPLGLSKPEASFASKLVAEPSLFVSNDSWLIDEKSTGPINAETDTETIVDEGEMDEDLQLVQKPSIIELFSPSIQAPIDVLKVDYINDIVYSLSSKSQKMETYDLSSGDHKVHQLTLNLSLVPQKDRVNAYAVDHSNKTLIHSLDNNLYIDMVKVHQFNSQITSLDLNQSSKMVSIVLESGDIKLFDVSEQALLEDYCQFTELPTDFTPFLVRFNKDLVSESRDLTLLSQDGKMIRYDYKGDSIVSRRKIGNNVTLSLLNSRYAFSSEYFIYVHNSTTLVLLQLATEDVGTFIVDQLFQVSSVTTLGDYFTLNYSNGLIELYRLSDLIGIDGNSVGGGSISPLSSCIGSVQYYEEGKTYLVKDICVELVCDSGKVDVYIAGSDMLVKRWSVGV